MLEVSERLKQAFMTDNVEKHIRITFPNGEHDDITNDKIEANSFQYTESLCSQESLKFGLCEANVLNVTAECDNIKGCVISVFIDAYYDNDVFTVPYGVFTVQSCKRQAGTHLRDIIAYTTGFSDNSKLLNDFDYWKASLKYINPDVETYDITPYHYMLENSHLDLSNETIVGFDSYDQIIRYYTNEFTMITVNGKHYYSEPWNSDWPEPITIYFKAINLQGRNYNFYSISQIEKSEQYDTALEIWTKFLPKITYFMKYKVDKNVITDISPNKKFTPLFSRILSDTRNGEIDTYYMQSTEIEINKVYNITQMKQNPGESGSSLYYMWDYILIPYKLTCYGGSSVGYKTFNIFDVDSVEIRGKSVSAIIAEPIEIPRTKVRETIKGKNVSIDNWVISDMEAFLNYDIVTYLNDALEVHGLFGKQTKSGGYDLIDINNNFALYPEDVLYPGNELYPILDKNYQPLTTTAYKAADYEEYKTHKIGYVRVTYLASDNEKYSITVECDSRYDNVYEMTNNSLFLNKVWTAEQVKEKIQLSFYPRIKDIEFNPATTTIKGLPFIEAGDVIKVYADEGTFKTFVFRRTLSGEQCLTDTIEAHGDERHENADLWIATAGQIEES